MVPPLIQDNLGSSSKPTLLSSRLSVSKFLVADDYRPDPSHIPPYTKSDDVEANEKAGVQIHEHLLSSSIKGIETGIDTGSIKDNSKIDETKD